MRGMSILRNSELEYQLAAVISTNEVYLKELSDPLRLVEREKLVLKD